VIEGLAARHTVVVSVGAAIGARHQMLDGCIGLGQQLATKEAAMTLGEQQSFEMTCHVGESRGKKSLAAGFSAGVIQRSAIQRSPTLGIPGTSPEA
jgi:hypothetical protein